MGMSGLSILTHGWHHPGLVEVEVCEHPELMAVVEVRPTIRGTIAPEVVGPAGAPFIAGASELRPEILGTDGPQTGTDQEQPHVVSAEELAPVIRDTEEE